MVERQEILFSIAIEGQPADKFAVVSFEGNEGLSDLYLFSVELVSSDPDINPDDVVGKAAALIIDRDGDVSIFHGIVFIFHQTGRGPEFYNYGVAIVPRLQNLTHPVQCQIFQDKDVKTIVGDVLKENGLKEDEDFVFRTTETYPVREYVVQYQESDFNFVRRLLEHYGIFFFFEHGESKEKLILADSTDAYAPIAGTAEIPYRDARDISPAGEAVGRIDLSQVTGPRKVILKDYNYRKPGLEIKGEVEAAPNGFGTFMEYGDHFKDPDEGLDLASVRAQEITCRLRHFGGSSACRHFRAGATFKLLDHFRSDYNTEYLLTYVVHSGTQLGIIGTASGGEPERPSYTNTFAAIHKSLRYVPERTTPRPRIYGYMHAVIDAPESSEYAEIDELGRYKVKLPFDLSEAIEGKASRFVRMMQPYSGPGIGMHFPLLRGTEVLLIHLDGDPDRPLIAGSVPNPETMSPVTSANHTQCAINTKGGSTVTFEDQDGSQRIHMVCVTKGTSLIMGAPAPKK